MEIDSCCLKECFSGISKNLQKGACDKFWELADYHKQNMFLQGVMKHFSPKGPLENRTKKNFENWQYFFPLAAENRLVCKQFFLKVFNISKNRISSIQKKIINGLSVSDGRGKHGKQIIKLTDDIKALIHQHCELIPHSQSHYSAEKSKLHYFDDPELNLNILYELFLDYYTSVTGDYSSPISISSYSKYFNHNVNFSFRMPRTDVCNFCFEEETKTEKSSEFIQHKANVTAYHQLKKEILLLENVSVFEFDFGQNLPLPKIPVSDQFYRRLLWIHIFNVHVYNSKRSYMFTFTEGHVKKGATTVCNLLLHAIFEEYKLQYNNKIYLFSDSCSGQNKNYLMLVFLSILANKLQIEIEHIYPVRGHSYCQCDRNFGMYGQKKKKMERIEIVDEYIKLIENSRNPPFIMVKPEDFHLNDFETIIKKKSKVPKKLQISKAVRIVYAPNGRIDVYENYNGKPETHIIENTVTFEDLKLTPPPPAIGISEEKIKDLKSLIRYLRPEGKQFFEKLLLNTLKRKLKCLAI